MTEAQTYLIGVISDTHGHLSPSVLTVFRNVDAIVHAGDIGGPEILRALTELAPVYAVRGNMDGGAWSLDLPSFELFDAGAASIYVLHDASHFDLEPSAAGVDAVISGHTHRPDIQHRSGVLYLNPGSATSPRYRHPPTVAVLTIRHKTLDAQIVELTPSTDDPF